MSGRKSRGPAAQKVPKAKRSNPERALNAFAIAEDEGVAASKSGKSQIGDSEAEVAKRRREDLLAEDAEEEDAPISKRLRRGSFDKYGNEIEGGSDSDGNEWVFGAVASDDDSSIDSDEAMGDHEQKASHPGHRGSEPSMTTNIQAHPEDNEVDLREDEDGDYGFDEERVDFAANAVDLTTAFDDSSDEEPDQRQNKIIRGFDVRSTSFKQQDDSDEMQSIGLSGSDVEEQDEGDFAALQSFVTSLDGSKKSDKASKSQIDLSQEATISSEYGYKPREKLTLADLLPTITDSTARRSLKMTADNGRKPADSRKGGLGLLPTPMPKRQKDRLDRVVATEKSKETLDRWVDTVKHNRRAEHLMFPLLDPDAESAKNRKRLWPITKSRVVSNLESTIQTILVESGLGVDGKSQDEQIQDFEELAANKMPIEEVKARRADLRRARELLFREEIRARRIKKIKSKSYRRVHRKERERNLLREKEALTAAGVEPSEDEQERLDRQRAEARMGQRHRQSRWAKSIKDTGRAAWDDEAREGIADMARRDEELRRRMRGKNAKGEGLGGSDSESSDDPTSDEDEEAFATRMRSKLDKVESVHDEAPGNRLLSMKFMQNAEATRKAQNDAAVEELRRELDGQKSGDKSDDDDEGLGRRRYGPHKTATTTSSHEESYANEFEERLGSDEEDSVSLAKGSEGSEDGSVEIFVREQARNTASSAKALGRNQRKNSHKLGDKPETQLKPNPWLSVPRKASKTKPAAEDSIIISTTPRLSTKSQPSSISMQVDTREDAPIRPNQGDEESDASFSGFSPPPPQSSLTNNQSLIRQAFAADDVLAEDTFAAEKAALAAEEEPSKLTSNALPGWGTWVGPGLSRREIRAAKRASGPNGVSNGSTQLSKSSEGVPVEKRKDQKLQKVIISERRVPKNAKYLATQLPHPFENRSMYERSLRLPCGPEFTTKETFQAMTKPRVLMKPGVIAPMRRPLM